MTLAGNQLFPDDSPWNQRVDGAPVAANSATLVNSIGASAPLHPDFGTIYEGGYIGIPYVIVSGSQPGVNVIIDAYPDESDDDLVPIPAGAPIEGDPLPSEDNDGDRHLIVYDENNNKSYELYRAFRPTETGDGQWHADSEAVWDMTQNSFRTPGDTSADAAGLPILPGLVRVDEVLDQGAIDHALRFTVPYSRNSYVFPASHQAGVNNAAYPRMGERFRLKQSFDISGYSAANRVILQALKTYGMIVADNGSGWYLSGAPSSRWDDDDLHDLSQILGNNFEAVDLSPRITSLGQTSGPTAGGTAVTINGLNFSGAAGMLEVRFGSTLATNVTILSDTQLVATSPPHAAGAVNVTVTTPYATSAPATSQFTYTSGPAPAQVVGRRLFYNQSGGGATRYDGNNLAINASDDNSIATDKTAYLWEAAGAATFANVSSYTKGINGIMVDITGSHPNISANDFIFRVGNNNSPGLWGTANAPTSISVRAGAGTAGSDRVTIIWNTGAPIKQWLEVIVLANADTGFPQKIGYPAGWGDVFFFGSAPGNTGAGDTAINSVVNVQDESAIRANPAALAMNIPITNIYDVQRNASVNVQDESAARLNGTNSTTALKYLNLTTAPAAPEADGEGDGGVASALAAPATTSQEGGVPKWLTNRIDNLDLKSGIPAKLFQYLHDTNSRRSRALLQKFDAVADSLGLDDELLDSLLADLT